LRHYLERHRGSRRDVVYERVMIDVPREQAWQRLIGRKGLGFGETAPAPGSSYRIAVPGAPVLEGRVLVFEPPKDFNATVESLNDALIRFTLDELPMRNVRDVTAWISAYGLTPEVVRTLRSGLGGLLVRLFPGSARSSVSPEVQSHA
jgi:hypothetical protein